MHFNTARDAIDTPIVVVVVVVVFSGGQTVGIYTIRFILIQTIHSCFKRSIIRVLNAVYSIRNPSKKEIDLHRQPSSSFKL